MGPILLTFKPNGNFTFDFDRNKIGPLAFSDGGFKPVASLFCEMGQELLKCSDREEVGAEREERGDGGGEEGYVCHSLPQSQN